MSQRVSPSTTYGAIVLAGGQSVRMGQDKALVSIGEETLLQHVCSVAQQCTRAVYVVTPWVDRYQVLINSMIEMPTRTPIYLVPEQVADVQRSHGPLIGFAQGLTHIQASSSVPQPIASQWVLLLACDLPRLQAEVIRDWAELLPDVTSETIALLPQNPQGWWEPLCGFYRLDCLTRLNTFIAGGGRSFQQWLSRQTVQVLPLPDPQVLLNCNTPEDVETYRSSIAPDL